MTQARWVNIQRRLAHLSRELMDFWCAHGVDREYGGFHGTLDRRGTPVPPFDKGLVQQARHLWTFSMWYERVAALPAIRQIADRTYDFLTRHFLDAADGEYVFLVSRDGRCVVESKKQLYAESFAIFALAEYGRVFDIAVANEQALRCFRSIDARAHDAACLGYDQSQDPGWLVGAQKGTNTHIHLLESFTALYRATGDKVVFERLEELLQVVTSKLLQPAHYVHKEFLRDWTPCGEPSCSYGHDLETAWLLLDAARALGREECEPIRTAAIRMGAHAAHAGFDEQAGGFFEEGPPGEAALRREKVWWVQAEALAGLWQLYRLTREPTYLDRLERTLTFIETKLRDAEFGEWYWGVDADGAIGPRGPNKGELWKASYHSLRALVFTRQWIEEEQTLPR